MSLDFLISLDKKLHGCERKVIPDGESGMIFGILHKPTEKIMTEKEFSNLYNILQNSNYLVYSKESDWGNLQKGYALVDPSTEKEPSFVDVDYRVATLGLFPFHKNDVLFFNESQVSRENSIKLSNQIKSFKNRVLAFYAGVSIKNKS